MENEKDQKPEPKKESFITRMQRQGVMVVKPEEPGELDVVEKLKGMEENGE